MEPDSASQQAGNGAQGVSRSPRRAASSREELEQAVLRQQQPDEAPDEANARSGIRRGRGSVPAAQKQKKPASGLDRDLRDEIDAW